MTMMRTRAGQLIVAAGVVVLLVVAPRLTMAQESASGGKEIAKPHGASEDVAPAADDDDAAQHPTQFMRVAEGDDGVMSLQIAVTRFESKDEGKPSVTLVGVSHIGDAAYYQHLQDTLNTFDVVLYESVMPPGVGGRSGDTEQQRLDYTRAAMTFIWAEVLSYAKLNGHQPASLAALREFMVQSDSRFGPWLDRAMIDGWDHPLEYRCTKAEGDKAGNDQRDAGDCVLLSYGADGKAGGEGMDEDIFCFDPPIALAATAYANAEDDRLQAQLAAALNLEFQLDAIDYAHDNWICADMTMDQLQHAMAAKGLDFDVLGGTLAGTSLSARVVKVLLKLVAVMDNLLGGAITDTFKMAMIEMLGDEKLIDQSLNQFGQGFGDVLIGERNAVVMNALAKQVARQDIKSIGVFYGAGHMSDFARRLHEQLGYDPVQATWGDAITVDLRHSSIPEDQMRQMRLMIRRSVQQAMSQHGRAPW